MAENKNKNQDQDNDYSLDSSDWWFDMENDEDESTKQDRENKQKEAEDIFWKHFGGGAKNGENEKDKVSAVEEEKNVSSTGSNNDGQTANSHGEAIAQTKEKSAASNNVEASRSLDEYSHLFDTPIPSSQVSSADTASVSAANNQQLNQQNESVIVQAPSIVSGLNNPISQSINKPGSIQDNKEKSGEGIWQKIKKVFRRKERVGGMQTEGGSDGKTVRKSWRKSALILATSTMLLLISSGYLGYKVLFQDKSCLGSKIVVAQIHTGDNLLVDVDDLIKSEPLISKGYVDSRISQIIYQVLKPGDIAIDVGSSYGYYSAYISRIVGSKGKVYSIEGNQKVYSLFKKSLYLNNINNVILFNNIVFSTVAEAKVNAVGARGNLQITLDNSKEGMFSELVTSLDALLPKLDNVSLILINSRGNEANIISGASKILMNSPNVKILTTWAPDTARHNINIESFVNQMISSGFRFWTVDNLNNRLVQLRTIKEVMDSKNDYLIIGRKI